MLLAAPRDASAGGVELTPVGGYRFGGAFIDTSTGFVHGLDASGSFGLVVDVDVSYDGQVELSWDRQPTRLSGTGTGMDVDAFQVGGLYLWGDEDARVRPFLLGTVGAIRYAPEAAGFEDVTRFGFALGLGAKTFAGRHVGFRLEALLLGTVFDANVDVFCRSPGLCLLRPTGHVLWQGEIRGGLVLRLP